MRRALLCFHYLRAEARRQNTNIMIVNMINVFLPITKISHHHHGPDGRLNRGVEANAYVC